MLQIQDTLVSLDLAERFFCCDLDACKGQCCLDGDAGAPLSDGEADEIRRVLPEIWDDLLPAARLEIEENGVSYTDIEGDEVTALVNGSNCVFATLDENGCWICAIERAFRQGRIDFYKPVSCHLYPVRIKEYDSFTAVNYHRWKICKAAEVLGRAKGIRAYRFLEGPLRRRFGNEWYEELSLTCDEYIKTYGGDNAID
ncbi:MAG: DUF3109 family protein [Muribaculaceae bacterium]|nr:DUF3109 family protein [Muribaculaceae bacterium]MDE6525929.1 DUF3109 family protein [Muribaculaceae bacterium]